MKSDLKLKIKMEKLKFYLILCLISFLKIKDSLEDDQMQNMAKLRHKLLVEQKYDKLSKPVKNHTSKISYFMLVHLFQIVDLNSKGILKTNMLLSSMWDDEHLTWNSSEYDNLEVARFGYNEIWKPDVVVWNYDKGNPWNAFEESDFLVDSNGTVNSDVSAHSITYCPLDLSEYPFDIQTCTIIIGPWMYNSKDINITTSKAVVGPYYSNGEWKLIKRKITVRTNLYSSIRIRLTLQRRTTIYTYFIVLPYIVSLLFTILMMTVDMDFSMKYTFAGLSIFIEILLIIFMISHIGFWFTETPRAIRCMSVNILFVVISILLTTWLILKNEVMNNKKLPFYIQNFLSNELISKIFMLNLESKILDQNLIPFVNEDDYSQSSLNINSIEIVDKNDLAQSSSSYEKKSDTLILETDTNCNETNSNYRNWLIFKKLINRLVLYIYLIVLVFFHI